MHVLMSVDVRDTESERASALELGPRFRGDVGARCATGEERCDLRFERAEQPVTPDQ
jgi:hypothetical protein